jgi:hypothetical protein
VSDDPKKDLADLITEANEAFNVQLQERHAMGAEKYGPFKFLSANTIEEAMFELIDLGNYARYTFIKLYLMNAQLDEKLGEDQHPGGFQPSQPRMQSKMPGMFGDNS